MIYLERVRNNLLNPDSKLTVVDGGGGHAFDSSTLAQYIGEYIHCISKLNIGRGQREVALLAERTPECICFMYALMFSGYTPFLVDVSCDRDVLSKIITPATNIFGSRKKKNKSDILIQDIPKVHPNKESVRFLREVCLDGDTPSCLFIQAGLREFRKR